MSSIYDWSLAAASNANADSDINWAEGQAPSTINNSARFMMQRLKEFVSDLGAITAVGGSANVLTFSAKSSFSTYSDGIRLAFRAAADNTGAVTLNANAAGAKPVLKFIFEGETALVAGEIQSGGIYEVIYSGALNGANGGWLLLNPTQQQIPAGFIGQSATSTAPSGWLECNGAAVSRTTYANLFSSIGTTWGAGDGSTTFLLPDFRGEFLRGWDHGKGTDTGRTFASLQADELKGHTHTGTTDSGGPSDPQVRVNASSTAVTTTVANTLMLLSVSIGNWFSNTMQNLSHTHGFTTNPTGGAETRPRNVAIMYIIKT